MYLDYNVSSGPFLSYEIEIGDGPGPELDNKGDFRGQRVLISDRLKDNCNSEVTFGTKDMKSF